MIAWNEMKDICSQVKFPEDAVAYFEQCYHKIFPQYADDMQKLAAEWMNADCDWRDPQKTTLSNIATNTGVSLYAVSMLFLLYCAIPLRQKYQEKGLSEGLFLGALQDLRYKLLECYSFHGEWGTFVLDWFRGFYLLRRFALGRLQYEKGNFPYKEYKGVLKEGDEVYFCHIPSSGPLLESDVLASLKQAHSFYRSELKNGILPVVCHSWLLYQPFETVFAGSGNVLKFRDMFDVIENQLDLTNRNFWRVFNQPFSMQALNDASPKTRMQKNLKDFLLSGQAMGDGFGVLVFDGEKIINV